MENLHVHVDYFSKYGKALSIKQKSSIEVGNFLFSLMCHCC